MCIWVARRFSVSRMSTIPVRLRQNSTQRSNIDMLGWGVPISILTNISNGTFSLFIPPFSNHSYWWKQTSFTSWYIRESSYPTTTFHRVSWCFNRVVCGKWPEISAPGSPWIWSRRASILCASPRASRKPARWETKGCGWEMLCVVLCLFFVKWDGLNYFFSLQYISMFVIRYQSLILLWFYYVL